MILGKDKIMKIIKRGDPNQVKVFRKSCDKCGTIFEFDETELVKENLSIHNPPDERLTYTYIECPVCTQKKYITL